MSVDARTTRGIIDSEKGKRSTFGITEFYGENSVTGVDEGLRYYSYTAQKIANYFPSWTQARQNRQSLFQQFVNAMTSQLDDAMLSTKVALDGLFVSTVSLDEIDLIYETRLDKNFEFQYDTTDFRLPKFIPPYIYADIGVGPFTVPIAEGNSIENFWYRAVPTRVTQQTGSLAYASVLDPTSIGAGIIESFTDPYEPGHLFITIADAESFLDAVTRENGKVIVSGINRQGLQDFESVEAVYNGTFKTLKEWKSLSKIETFGIGPIGATIGIEAIDLNLPVYRYEDEVYYDEAGGREIYIKPSLINGESHLEYQVYNISGVEDFHAGKLIIHEGWEEKIQLHTIDLVRLVQSNDLPSGSIVDVALQPDKYRVFVLNDDGYFRVYDTRVPYVDGKNLSKRTADAATIIATFDEYATFGDTVKVSPYRLRSIKKIIKYKWDLGRPTGSDLTFIYNETTGVFDTSVYLDNNNPSGWSKNPYQLTSSYDLSTKNLEYTLDHYGEYTFTLNVMYEDGSIEIDQKTFHAKAIASLGEFEHNVANANGIAFNSDNELCIIDISNDIYKFDLNYDIAMIDIDSKIVYTREEYDDGITVSYL